jgi:PIN domain nuclease of toxin-antitoxin system
MSLGSDGRVDARQTKVSEPSNRDAETGRMPVLDGRGDPGDCFIIATARMKRVPVITRDRAMIDLAQREPVFLAAGAC